MDSPAGTPAFRPDPSNTELSRFCEGGSLRCGALAAELAALRPRPGSMVRCHALLSLRDPGRRAEFPNARLERPDELIVPLVTARAPGLPGWYGAGPDTAAVLLIAAGDHLGPLRSEAPPRLKITVRDESCSWPTRANPPMGGGLPGTGVRS